MGRSHAVYTRAMKQVVLILLLGACGGAVSRPVPVARIDGCDGPSCAGTETQQTYATGSQLLVLTEWHGSCGRDTTLEPGPSTEACDFVDYDAKLICDNPSCVVAKKRSDAFTVTLGKAGRY